MTDQQTLPERVRAHFDVYVMGIVHASVCTDLPVDAATARLNAEHPTGIDSAWQPSTDSTFLGGQPNPCVCERDPTRKHFLFSC
jgi:hypothetical protein